MPPAGRDVRLWPSRPGMTVGCTNPGAAGLDAAGYRSTAIGTRGSTCRCRAGRSAGRREGAPPTPFLRTEGLVSARCVNDGPRGYLSVRTNADPSDKRTDRIGGEVGLLGMFLPGWGMHLADIADRPGRPHPRRSKRSVRAIQNSSSTGSSSARASLSASIAEGMNTPFSTVLTVLRRDPDRARRARPGSARARFARSLSRLASRSAIAVRAPLEHAEADQRRGDAERHDEVDRFAPLTGSNMVDEIAARSPPASPPMNPQPHAPSARLARVFSSLSKVAHFARLQPESPPVASASSSTSDRTSQAPIFTWSTARSPSARRRRRKLACWRQDR